MQLAARLMQHIAQQHGDQFQMRRYPFEFNVEECLQKMVLFRIVHTLHIKIPAFGHEAMLQNGTTQ
jgi:hypothetical protein